MIILDHEHLEKMPIFEGSIKFITDLTNVDIVFPVGKLPYTWILSFHAQESHKDARAKGWITNNNILPDEYGLPLKNDTLLCRNACSDEQY